MSKEKAPKPEPKPTMDEPAMEKATGEIWKSVVDAQDKNQLSPIEIVYILSRMAAETSKIEVERQYQEYKQGG